jgi:two-component sensor histidine kinase
VATPSPRKHREDIDKWRQRLCDALRLSNVVLFGQDEELRYVWIENPPNGLDSGDIIGKRDEDFLAPKTAEQTTSAKLSVLRTGEPKTIEFSWESEETPRWYELRIEALHGADRRVTGVNCAAIDVSDRKLTESHLRVLLLELAHRSKNLLAVIQGISNQTAQGSASVDEFVRRFSGRLMSLARAHDILSDQNWRGAGMHELIRTQVLLFGGERQTRIAYEGDALYLRPTAAQHVGLALYELTANALKFGALSGRTGNVKIRWFLQGGVKGEEPQFTLSWEENKGPPVQMPNKRHFGRILLEQVVPIAVQGNAALNFEASGIQYILMMPGSELLI